MNKVRSSSPFKILIVRFGSLGDIVHGLPAQQELHRKYPEAGIHWLAEKPYKPLLETVPFLDKVWAAEMKKWRKNLGGLRHFKRLVKQLRAEEYDLVYDFQGLLKSAITARLAGGRSLLGFDRSLLREKAARFFYSQAASLEPGNRHQVECALDLVAPPRFTGKASAAINFDYPPECIEYIERNFAELEISTPPVLLNPGAAWETKRWDTRRFVQLAEKIEKSGYPVIYTTGPGEEHLLEAIRNESSWPVKTFPTTIVQLSALCSRSALMVAGDTGPLHLAVASGTPTVAILGPAHAWRTGPFNPLDEVVQHEKPCPRPYSRTCPDHFCMDIPVELVYEAALRRMASD